MRMIRFVVVVALSLGLASGLAVAEKAERDWPAWSGPRHDLTTTGGGVFERPTIGLEVQWSRALGSGYSGILVVGKRVVTGFSDGTSDFVVALDSATGEELWRYRIGAAYKGHDGSDDGPMSTPTVRKGRVFGLGTAGELFAVRLSDGAEIWSHRLVDELGARSALYGFASAPTWIDGVLVVETGSADGHSIAGFNPANGKLLWSTGEDAVDYQSPMALTVDGAEQVFAITNRRFLGLAPRTGEVLWSHEHTTDGDGFTRAQPIPLGNARILLTDRESGSLLRVEKAADGYALEEIWRSRALYRSFASPLPHGDHLYGYAGMTFLTCVDAATGATVWKSRDPGEGHVVLVDDHLVIFARNGDVVVVEATPDGYREKARVNALERGSFTRPTFAGGRIFVRNLDGIAALGVAELPADRVTANETPQPPPEPLGILAALARDVAAADDKAAAIDAFMAAHPDVPILDDGDLVHFVFRGDVDDLMLKGNMVPWERERPMSRLPGTDFYFRTMSLEPGGRFEYTYAIFDEFRLDPLNPRKSAIEGQERSVVTTRDFVEAGHLQRGDRPRGRIETITWKSPIVGDERDVQVYLPAGHDATQTYPLLMLYGSQGALEWGRLDRTLDNLVGSSVAPLIVALVPSGHFSESGSGAPDFIRALETELLPLLERYGISPAPADRAMMGNGFAGWFVSYVVVSRPDLFGKVATQSPIYGDAHKARLLDLIATADPAGLEFFIAWTPHETRMPDGGTIGQLLESALVERGYAPVTLEMPGGAGWGTSRQHTDQLLETLFPLKR